MLNLLLKILILFTISKAVSKKAWPLLIWWGCIPRGELIYCLQDFWPSGSILELGVSDVFPHCFNC